MIKEGRVQSKINCTYVESDLALQSAQNESMVAIRRKGVNVRHITLLIAWIFTWKMNAAINKNIVPSTET